MREQAKEEAARLRFADAAALYQQAAALLPTEDRDERGSDLVSTGLSWTDQGRDFGDNAALLSATAAFSAALGERTRERVPLDWAVTQNNLGAALATLGEREGATARLDKAVAAYRAALQEMTRERVPLDWSYSRLATRWRDAREAYHAWKRPSTACAAPHRNMTETRNADSADRARKCIFGLCAVPRSSGQHPDYAVRPRRTATRRRRRFLRHAHIAMRIVQVA